MKILKFNDTVENIFIYNKLYGEKYNSIDDIIKDLNKFDNLKIKYDILITNNSFIVGIFARIPGNLMGLYIPNGYNLSQVYDTERKVKDIKDGRFLTKEELKIEIQAQKFNI